MWGCISVGVWVGTRHVLVVVKKKSIFSEWWTPQCDIYSFFPYSKKCFNTYTAHQDAGSGSFPCQRCWLPHTGTPRSAPSWCAAARGSGLWRWSPSPCSAPTSHPSHKHKLNHKLLLTNSFLFLLIKTTLHKKLILVFFLFPKCHLQ